MSIVALICATAGAGWWVLRDDGGAAQPRAGTPTTTTAMPEPQCDPASVLAEWPLEQRLAQLLMVGVDPVSAGAAEELISGYGVGGLFIGGEQVGIFTDGDLHTVGEMALVPPLVAVDDEGGRVQRIDEIVGPIPSSRQMAQTMVSDDVRALAFERGRALRELGVTMDLAPVVDVSGQSTQEVIGDRSFSDRPDVVTEYARAFADGLSASGVFPVFKHFPGHGRARGDSHEQAAVTPPLEELRSSDLLPYASLLGTLPAGVMVGHLDVPGLTQPGIPASVSPEAIGGLLREELRYDGFVITDDLSGMAAITDRFSVSEAVVRSIAAGADMALLVNPDDLPPALEQLSDAVRAGSLDEAAVNRSVQRVLAVKSFDPCVIPVAEDAKYWEES